MAVLSIEYDPALVPEGGSSIERSNSLPIPATWKDAAGHSFHEAALRLVGYGVDLELEDEDDAAESDTTFTEEELALRWGPGGNGGKKRRRKGAKKDAPKEYDYYALLGLAHLRYKANNKQIKDAYREAALKFHPDKNSVGVTDDEEKAKIEEKFKAVSKAYETMCDRQKRREYDSMDEFDDSFPLALAEGEDFYVVFGEVFERNARWSERKPVPKIGDDSYTREQVQNFYRWWYQFKSWREYTHEDEEDLEQAECREHKREIIRYNMKLREKEKKREAARIRSMVETAEKLDPRMRAWASAERGSRKAAKEAKEAAKRAEAEAKAREEAEAKAREEEAAAKAKEERESAKKQKEKEKKALRKEKQRFRTLAEEQLGPEAAPPGAVEDICASFSNLEELQQLCDGIEAAANTEAKLVLFKEAAAKADADTSKYSKGVERVIISTPKKSGSMSRSSSSSSMKRSNSSSSMNGKDSARSTANGHSSDSSGWTDAELVVLRKAVVKHPRGTRRRWEVIAALLPGKSVDDVIEQVKKEEANPNKEEDSYAKFVSDRKGNAGDVNDAPSEREAVSGSVVVGNGTSNGNGTTTKATSNGDSAGDDADSGEWSKIQQMALVKAMKQFGKEMSDRWERIAMAVPGRTMLECKRKAVSLVKKKKEASSK